MSVSPALEALDQARDAAAAAVVRALQPIIPRGHRAKYTIVVHDGIVRPEDVTVEMRPAQQPKA